MFLTFISNIGYPKPRHALARVPKCIDKRYGAIGDGVPSSSPCLAMITIVGVNLDKVRASLTELERRQLPFAMTLALTRTGTAIKTAIVHDMPNYLDRPTPYTIKSVYRTLATKDNLRTTVGIDDEAFKGIPPSKFLRAQIFGGARNAKRSEKALRHKGLLKADQYIVPGAGVRLDRYGNITAGTMTQILSVLQAGVDPTQYQTRTSRTKNRTPRAYFVGRPGGKPLGVWERYGAGARRVRPILLFVSQPQYQKRLPFFEIADHVAQAEFPAQFRAALHQAIATAR